MTRPPTVRDVMMFAVIVAPAFAYLLLGAAGWL